MGAAAGAVIALAIIRDLYTGRAAATMFSRLMLVMGVAPVLAPTLGGELLRVTSWRGLFVALAVYGVLVLVATALALRESLPMPVYPSYDFIDALVPEGDTAMRNAA